jgi:hypothetical protein
VTDDTVAFQNALNYAVAHYCTYNSGYANAPLFFEGFIDKSTVEFPAGVACKISALTINTGCLNIEGNGATLDFSHSTAPIAITTTSNNTTGTAYAGNTTVRDFMVIGPGQSTTSGTIGIYSGAVGTHFQDISVEGFNYAFEWGSNSWDVTLTNPQFYNSGTDFYCAAGGENYNVQGGAFFNSDTAVDLEAWCELTLNATSLDYLTNAVAIDNGGMLRLNDPHIEFNQLAGSVFTIGGVNSFANLYVDGGYLVGNAQSGSGADMTSVVANNGAADDGGYGPWGQIDNMSMVNMNSSASCTAGSGDNCVTGHNASQVFFQNDRAEQGQNISTTQPEPN